eukprot:gene13368-13483_t
MAQQRPGHDPATAAMSAIEEALNLSLDDMMEAPVAAKPASPSTPVLEMKLPHVEHAGLDFKPIGEPISAATNPVLPNNSDILKPRNETQISETKLSELKTPVLSPTTPPANDDRRVAGQIVHAMQVRPSNWPIALALVVSVLWLGLVGFYISKSASLENIGALNALVGNSQLPSWILLGLGPVIFLFIVAALVRRVQEIRLSAQSMTKVAMRLAEPETMATEQVVTLSQAIRREVASMGDGIERALARASELETMVRTEVSNLERSYSDNERRIRVLVDGLSSEREAIVSHSDRVRSAISGAHDKMSMDLDAVSRSLTERVQNVGQNVTSSLGAKSEEIFNALSMTNEQFLQEFDSQSQQVVGRLAQSREEIAQTIESRIHDLDQHFRQTSDALLSEFVGIGDTLNARIGETGKAISENVYQHGENIAAQLHETSAKLDSTVGVQGEALTQRLSETGERIAALLVARTTEAHDVFQASGEAFATMIDGHQTHIHHELTRHSSVLSDHFVQTSHHALEAMGEHAALIQQNLGSVLEQTEHVLNTHSNEFNERFLATTQSAIESMGAQATALDARITRTTEQSSAIVRMQSDALATTYQQAVQNAITSLAVQSDELGTQLATFDAKLRETTDHSTSALRDTTEQSTSAMQMHSDAFHAQYRQTVETAINIFADQGEAFNNKFINTAEHALSSFTEQTGALDQKFAQTASDAIAAIGVHGDRVNETLVDRLNTFEDAVLKHGSALADRIISGADRITTDVDQKLGAVEAAFTIHGEAFLNQLDSRTRSTAGQLEAQIVEFEQRASSKSQEISHSLDTLISKIDAGLDTRSRALNEMLAHRAVDVAKVLGEGGREVTRALDAKAIEIDQILLSRSTALTETLSGKAEEINRTLGGKATEIADTLDQRISTFEERVVRRLDTVSSELDERGKSVADILRERAREIDDMLLAHGSSLNSGTVTIRQLLENEGLGLVTALTNRGGDVAREIAEIGDLVTRAIESRGTEIVSHIAQQQGDLTNAIDNSGVVLRANMSDLADYVAQQRHELTSAIDNSGVTLRANMNDLAGYVAQQRHELTNAIDNSGDKLRENMQGVASYISQQKSELTQAIDETSSALRTNIEMNAAASIATLTDTHGKMRNEFAGMLAELGRRNQTLETLSSDSLKNLGLIENNLDARVKEFDAALNTINHQVIALAQTSATTMTGAKSLAERLDAQGKNLIDTSNQLSRTQSEVDAALEARVQGLENLLARINERSEDLDNVMGAFYGMIDESFKSAETRARDIGSFLVESTQSAQTTIGQHFEAIRSTTGKERERTASALRAAYEQAKSEMEEIFSGTAERFKGSTEDLLEMANAIRRELDATRQELRRSTTDLPQETANQTANLRRVVADQINALNELTEIATRSGRSLDIATPDNQQTTRRFAEPLPKTRAPEPRQPEPRPQETRALEPPRQEVAPRFLPPVPTQAPIAPREDFIRARQQPAAPAAPRQAAPAQTAPQERGPGWLSDLLNRASQEDTTKAPARPATPAVPQTAPNNSLDSISLDIARMIDHDAAVDLWDRYSSGERNVFSRRIYTPQGQNTFDEIRRRYRSDAEFRETVNRYIQEFERLDSEVSRSDRDGSMTRKFLISDTGKVYTMLAHAAGRFD